MTNTFDEPTHVWVIEYLDTWGDDESHVTVDTDVMSVFEYPENPLTEADAVEELRYSMTAWEDNKDATLEDIGIKIVSIIREEC